MTFEPKIAGFLCNWCSYTGADLAGTARMKYLPNVRVIRVMCSGRIDATFVTKAFAMGADGVIVSGCHFGDCHYLEGNHKAVRRMSLLKNMLPQFGIEKERLLMTFISASEGELWAKTVNEFTETIKKLGPLNMQQVSGITIPEDKQDMAMQGV